MKTTTKTSSFRHFCNQKWFEHKDEVFSWTGQPCKVTPEQYFSKYKWFLKTIYLKNKENV